MKLVILPFILAFTFMANELVEFSYVEVTNVEISKVENVDQSISQLLKAPCDDCTVPHSHNDGHDCDHSCGGLQCLAVFFKEENINSLQGKKSDSNWYLSDFYQSALVDPALKPPRRS